MMQLVWNADDPKVADLLEQHMRSANRILIAVAFLSSRGWKMVKGLLQDRLELDSLVEFFVGTDFYQTDPSALREAEALLRDRAGCALWLCRTKPNSVFHPKLYVFESDDAVTVVVGSANLTFGGMRGNREVCCSFSTTSDSHLAEQLEAIFASYRSDKNTCQATPWQIARYEGEWERYRHHVSRAVREADKEVKALPSIQEGDLRLRQYLEEYLSCKKQQEDYEFREQKYRRIPALLDRLTVAKTKTEFLDIYEQLVGKSGRPSLWHSGGLFRKKNQVASSRYKTGHAQA